MRRNVYRLLLGVLVLFAVPAAAIERPMLPEEYITEARGQCHINVPAKNRGIIEELAGPCENFGDVKQQLGLKQTSLVEPVEVRIVESPDQMELVAPPQAPPPSWSQAVAYPDLHMVILSLRDRVGSPVTDLNIVLEHELSHLALRKALGGAEVPRWFSEGVAIQQSERSSFRRYWILWSAARGRGLMPLNSIERYPDHPGVVNLAYAQAADFVGFMLRKKGWTGLRMLISQTSEGVPFDEAFELAFGHRLQSLEYEWRGGLESRWQWLPLITGTGAVWGFALVLFLLAYVVSKRRRKRRLVEMGEEEEAIEQVIQTLDSLKDKAPHSIPEVSKTARVPTKIRVDDDIHTLH
jgi:Peptidase MA superfamily